MMRNFVNPPSSCDSPIPARNKAVMWIDLEKPKRVVEGLANGGCTLFVSLGFLLFP